MTDIRTEVELRHPVDRVWRALTDQQLLEKWLGATDLVPEDGAPFELRPIGLPGLDGEVNGAVVEVEEARRLVLRWREHGVRMLVTFELTDTEDGCRLVVRQSGTDGHWTAEQEERRRHDFDQLLTGPLPAVLDWLAFRELDFTSETVVAVGPDDPAADAYGFGGAGAGATDGDAARRRRRPLVAGLIAAAIVVGGALVVIAVLRPPGSTTTTAAPQAGTPAPSGVAISGPASPAAAGAVPSRAGTPQASATASAPASPSATPPTPTPPAAPTAGVPAAGNPPPPARPNLDARYARASNELFGYTGEIVLTNSGTAEAAGWTVTVVLQNGTVLGNVSGANHEEKGRTVTFTGAAVPANGSARFTFQVRTTLSERQPESCRVGDRACAGL